MNQQTLLSTRHLFTLWFGAAISITEILAGGILAPLGFMRGLFAIILGHLIGTSFLILAGRIGFESKLPAIASTGLTFGSIGSRLFSFLNILQLIGWTAIMILSAAQSLEVLSQSLWKFGDQTLWVWVVGSLVFLWIWLGPKGSWKSLNMGAVGLLAILTLSLSWTLFYGQGQILLDAPATNGLPFGLGLELSLVMPLSWVPLIADYTRFAKNKSSATFGSGLGYFLGSSWMYVIGLGLAIIAGSSDLPAMMLAAKLGLSALGILLLSTVTTTFLDAYSAGVCLSHLWPKMPEKSSALGVTVIGILLALWANMDQYENFLLIIGSVFVPLFTILFVDYFIHKKRETDNTLILNVSAFATWFVGLSLYHYLLSLNWDWGSTLPIILITGILYYFLGKSPFLWRKSI